MEKIKLEAKKRKVLGRKVKKLRREGILPANLYGKKIKSQALGVLVKDFLKVYQEAGETGLVDLKIDGETKPVLIHNVQFHPVTDQPIHIDFHQVSLTEKTTATIPIELVGESPAAEKKIGILIQPLSELEVEALPGDFPEHLVVNISSLKEVDDALTVGDIEVDKKKVKILANEKEIVAKIEPLAEEVVAPPPAEEVPAEEVPAEEVPEEEGPPEEAKAPTEEARPEPAKGKPAEKPTKEKPAEEKKE